MVSFDALHARTTQPQWAADARWRNLLRFRVGEHAAHGLLVLGAHPDDETLGVGGLIYEAGSHGLPVNVVVATEGGRERRCELDRALRILNPQARASHLGFPDGALKWHEEELVERLSSVFDAFGVHENAPDAPTVVSVWSDDRHGDHRTLGAVTQRLLDRRRVDHWQYPIWLWQWGTTDDFPWATAQVVAFSDQTRERKRQALAAFTSQMIATRGSDGVLSEEFLSHARDGAEVLFSMTAQAPDRVLREHFEQMHAESPDPWSVRSSWYERRKRAIAIAVLPRERFNRALDVGCSNGELSAELAERCGNLLAVDGSESAVVLAAQRLASYPHASARRMSVPDSWPTGTFDLVMISEIAYYLAPSDWARLIHSVLGSLTDDGVVVLCHWTGHAGDFAQSARDAHASFQAVSGFSRTTRHEDRMFLLEIFEQLTAGDIA